MKDELVMSKLTGELIPATMAIKLFYTIERSWKECWTDEYELTGLESDIELSPPNFTKTLNI